MRLGSLRFPTLGTVRLWISRAGNSFWLLPLVLGVIGIGLALGMMTLEKHSLIVSLVVDQDWLIVAPDSARAVLTAIAGAMISATSIVYSLSLLIRTIAASNLGPRLVESFDKARVNRLTLGMQLLTFTYSITLLYNVGNGTAVISVSVMLAILIAIVALGYLVVFVNAVARQSHVDATIADIARTLRHRMATRPAPEDTGPASETIDAKPVRVLKATAFGYVQAIDRYAALHAVAHTEAIVAIDVRAGDFVVAGAPLLRVMGAELDDERCQYLQATVTIGAQRIDLDDPRFRIMLLVEMALRALSPGVNDVFTAVACTDNLAGVLGDLNGADLTPGVLKDDEGRPKVYSKGLTFQDLVDTALHPLRQHGAGVMVLALALLSRLGDLLGVIEPREARQLLLHHAELLAAQAAQQATADVDRETIAGHIAAIRKLETRQSDRKAGDSGPTG